MPRRRVKLPFHEIDLAAGELRGAAGQHVDLRPRSFAVLRVLAENAGCLVSKDEIIANVWDDVAVTEDSLTQCIAEIRKVIGDDDRRILRTVPRRGYLLAATESKADTRTEPPTLAVCPFRSPAGGKGAALALGVASEIINELARNRDLRLIGRDSSFALAGQPARAQELGEQLGARYLVEGTAQRVNDKLMVDVQLVDARDGLIVWGDSFSAKAIDIPETQRLIANRIAAGVRVGMHETEKQATVGRAPRDLEVYELTLRAMTEHRFTAEATLASRRLLEEAIRRDPNYAPAWTQLGWVNMIDVWAQLSGEWPPSRRDEVIEQFHRAIDLDPNSSKAYRGLGQMLIVKGDTAQGLIASRRGYELGPSEPNSLLFLGLALFESGDLAEGTRMIDQALDLHPLKPSYFSYFHTIMLWANDKFEEALTEAETCARLAPCLVHIQLYRTLALVGLGRLDEAKDQVARYRTLPWQPVIPPHPPELARRFFEGLQAAGWRPSLAAQKKAV